MSLNMHLAPVMKKNGAYRSTRVWLLRRVSAAARSNDVSSAGSKRRASTSFGKLTRPLCATLAACCSRVERGLLRYRDPSCELTRRIRSTSSGAWLQDCSVCGRAARS